MNYSNKIANKNWICFRNIVTSIMVIMLLIANITVVFAANSISNLRYSNSASTTRIVLDVVGKISYSDKTTDQQIIVVDIEGSANNIREVSINDKIVKNASLKNIGETKTQLIVELSQAVEYKIFQLKGPDRLVVDVYKKRPAKAATTIVPSVVPATPVENKPPVNRKTVKKIAEGFTYTLWEEYTPIGPIVLHELKVSPKRYKLQVALAEKQILGRNKATVILQNALAGINASYFAKDGTIIGNAIYEGKIVSSETLARTTLGIMADGSLKIAPSVYKGVVVSKDKRLMISAVNRSRLSDELVIFNEYYAPNTGTNEFGLELTIKNGRVIAINSKGNSALRPSEYVVSAHGIMQKVLEDIKVGDAVSIEESIGKDFINAKFAQGAGPLLIKDGVINVTSTEEYFLKDIAVGRAPRTAVGITAKKDIILLVVDGRSASSKGVTLIELAGYLQEMGAVDAMNFDGGGSSELVINKKVMNYPSDNGRERMIASALAVYPK